MKTYFSFAIVLYAVVPVADFVPIAYKDYKTGTVANTEEIDKISEAMSFIEHIRRKEVNKEAVGTADFPLDQYHDYDEIRQWLNRTARSCTQCELRSIGKSYEGRDLLLLTVSGALPIVFVECGAHAREWVSPAVCLHLIHTLVGDVNSSKPSHLVRNFSWQLLVLANPDGYQYSRDHDRMWRKTRRPTGARCAGTDYNRNFGFHYGGDGSSPVPCSEIFRGRRAFSEPETVALRRHVTAQGGAVQVYLSLHSYGQYLMLPYSYSRNTPPDYHRMLSVAQQTASAIESVHGRRYEAGHSTELMGATSGSSDDWMKGVAEIPFVYTLELRDTGLYGFMLPPEQIVPNAEEVMAGISKMTAIIHQLYPHKINSRPAMRK